MSDNSSVVRIENPIVGKLEAAKKLKDLPAKQMVAEQQVLQRLSR